MKQHNRIGWIGRSVFAMTLIGGLTVADSATAEVKLPNIFTDSMVLQQKQENKIWGKDNPGQVVTVSVGEQGTGKLSCQPWRSAGH
jgi:hypothetical protein